MKNRLALLILFSCFGLINADIRKALPGHYNGNPFSYSPESTIYFGATVSLSLFLLMYGAYKKKDESNAIRLTSQYFRWTLWGLSALALLVFQINQIQEDQVGRWKIFSWLFAQTLLLFFLNRNEKQD